MPIPSHPYPTLSPTLPYPSGLSCPYPSILSPLLLFPRIPSPPTYPRTPILPLHSLPSAPLLPLTLRYHIPPDRSRGQNISFPTSLGYHNTSLLYSTLPYRPYIPTPPPHPMLSIYFLPFHSSTLYYPTHSAHLPYPNTISYCILPSPLLASPPISPYPLP